MAWSSTDNSHIDPTAFIFSLVNPNDEPIRIKCEFDCNAIYCSSEFGPTFGSGYDIFVANNANHGDASYANLGHSYHHPLYANGTPDADNFLAGSYNFRVAEIEVFKMEQ